MGQLGQQPSLTPSQSTSRPLCAKVAEHPRQLRARYSQHQDLGSSQKWFITWRQRQSGKFRIPSSLKYILLMYSPGQQPTAYWEVAMSSLYLRALDKTSRVVWSSGCTCLQVTLVSCITLCASFMRLPAICITGAESVMPRMKGCRSIRDTRHRKREDVEQTTNTGRNEVIAMVKMVIHDRHAGRSTPLRHTERREAPFR